MTISKVCTFGIGEILRVKSKIDMNAVYIERRAVIDEIECDAILLADYRILNP